jgi:hypothetical protein
MREVFLKLLLEHVILLFLNFFLTVMYSSTPSSFSCEYFFFIFPAPHPFGTRTIQREASEGFGN